MKTVSEKGYAKINLTLDVLGKRPDGYHEVKMIMQSLDLYDEISISTGEVADSLTNTQGGISGGISGGLPHIILEYTEETKRLFPSLSAGEDNLIIKAARLFFEECGRDRQEGTHKGQEGIHKGQEGEVGIGNIKITLDKHIPMAAGLAGGSADAAATLLALDRLFETNLSMEKLLEMGKKLGADVPFCIIKNTSLAEGIGEKLSPVKMPFAPACLLVKPEASISTPVIYRDVDALIEAGNAVRPDTDKVLEAINCVDKETFYKELVNIFEPVSSVYCEDIFKYKAMIKEYGADASLMSGSGPTVFGLFEDETVAQRAYEELRKQTAESGQDVRVFLTHFYS